MNPESHSTVCIFPRVCKYNRGSQLHDVPLRERAWMSPAIVLLNSPSTTSEFRNRHPERTTPPGRADSSSYSSSVHCRESLSGTLILWRTRDRRDIRQSP